MVFIRLLEAAGLAAFIGLARRFWLLLLVDLRHEPLIYGYFFDVQTGIMRRLVFLYLAE